MPKRNDKRDTAKAEYIKRRRSGEKVNLKDLAEKLGVTHTEPSATGNALTNGTMRWSASAGDSPETKTAGARGMPRAIPAAVRRTETPTQRRTVHIARFTLNV